MMGDRSVHLQKKSSLTPNRRLPVTMIDALPDDALVGLFNFYVNIDFPSWDAPQNPWLTLVHVCRRWRYIVFASPRRLNLRLEYGGHRPMSEVLDAWPVLPVILTISRSELFQPKSDRWWDNRAAVLESEHSNRVCEIYISNMISSRWERFAAAMQKPFPKLTHLDVSVVDREVAPILPDAFLGGTAPRLRTLFLRSIPFPSIPKLLLSANGLVKLSLRDIPDSGYISPDMMATALAVMTRLETLRLGFHSPQSRPDPASRPPPSPTRIVLPALTELLFEGVYEYLEDLLARIDVPLLDYLRIIFFMDLDFDVPQLHRLIGHAEEFETINHAMVLISDRSIQLDLYPKTGPVDDLRRLVLEINCRELDWQLSSLAHVCSSSFPIISALEELEIRGNISSSHWKDDMEDNQWVELLDRFTSLKNLYLSDGIARRVCNALQELSEERATDVLPAHHNLFVRGSSLQPILEAMIPFVAARQLSGHPIVIECWKDRSWLI